MKQHNLALLGYGIGGIIAVLSAMRWFALWIDISQGLMGVGIGLLICILSYVYNYMRNTDERFDDLKSRVDALVMWWQKSEHEDVVNRAKGGENEN